MIRGTIAQFDFKLPYKCSDLFLAKITFWQPNNNGPSEDRPLPIVKVLRDFSEFGDSMILTVILNEGETLRFSEKTKAYVQLRASTIEGAVFASQKQMLTVESLCDDTILGEEILPTPNDDGFIILDGEQR